MYCGSTLKWCLLNIFRPFYYTIIQDKKYIGKKSLLKQMLMGILGAYGLPEKCKIKLFTASIPRKYYCK